MKIIHLLGRIEEKVSTPQHVFGARRWDWEVVVYFDRVSHISVSYLVFKRFLAFEREVTQERQSCRILRLTVSEES
jgi:hypothetical protein